MISARKACNIVATALLLGGILCSCAENTALPNQTQPIDLEEVENLYRVSPELYRSGQPKPEGFTKLEQMGVRSVLNLREYHRDAPKAAHTGLHIMEHPMAAGKVTAADIEACLRLIQNAPKPVLVHCWHGSDRTGIIVAAYRIVFQGWSVEAAEKEFREEAYGHHEFWYGNLTELLRTTDWEAMKQRLLRPQS